jgi:hypothetical protein
MADNVRRMRALLERHPDWTWTPPQAEGLAALRVDHVVTFALNGKPEKAAHHDLGKLADFMEAVDRSTMSSHGTPG